MTNALITKNLKSDRPEEATYGSALCGRKTTGRSGCRVSALPLLVVILLASLIFNISQYRRSMVQEVQSSQGKLRSEMWNPDEATKDHTRAFLFKPEQLHLSLGTNYSERFLTWSTMAYLPGQLGRVEYLERCEGLPEKRRSAVAIMESKEVKELDPQWVRLTGRRSRTLYNYRAKLQKLKDGCQYYYKAVTHTAQRDHFDSDTYHFTAKNIDDPRATVNLALYGDLGLINSRSIGPLTQYVDAGAFDVIIHNGDFAYDLNDRYGEVGDEFMRKIEPIAARVPYQTSVGNHEVAENFTHYDQRFTMINSGDGDRETNGQRNNFYYSFNVGPIHFVAFSTEFYYFLNRAGPEALNNQWEWLKKDLSHASSPSERAKRPWIIVFGHRPMYCSSRSGDDCSKEDNILRKGLPFVHSYALEKLFYDFGVDVELYSHEHQYERFLPIYDSQVINGTDKPDDPYYNPLAPVHIISGSAGCDEKLDPFMGKARTGSVKQIADYGFTSLTASRCQLRFRQISDDQKGYQEMADAADMLAGNVVDEFVITKTMQNFPSASPIDLGCKHAG